MASKIGETGTVDTVSIEPFTVAIDTFQFAVAIAEEDRQTMEARWLDMWESAQEQAHKAVHEQLRDYFAAWRDEFRVRK